MSVTNNTAAAFQPLDGAHALMRIVEAILGAVAEPSRVVVAAAEALVSDVRAALASQGLGAVSVVAVSGAATRADCIRTAVESLQREPFSTSHVLIHDIASPLASAELSERVVAAMRDGCVIVVPILPVTDSVKAVDANGLVTATVDRSELRAVQHPRGFTVDALAELLGQDTSDDIDEIEAALGAAAHITLVEGDPEAFRVELPQDAEFVEAIIASRGPNPQGS